MEPFDTNWDPYEALIQCQNNIQQCVFAINEGSEIMKQIGAKYKHQEQRLHNLEFEHKKLKAITNHLLAEVARLNTPKTPS
jgi:hypothetical protein